MRDDELVGTLEDMLATPQNIETVALHEDGIRLGQLLKFVNAVEDGLEAKAVIADGEVFVNAEQETRRGRQLHAGDLVSFGGQGWKIELHN